MRRLIIAAAFVASIGIVAAGAAFAGGGNSGAAAACQKGGWTSLHRGDGSGFGNTGACVGYAARGGVLETLCQPGTYSATGATPCSPAGIGFYVDSAGATSETPCPTGQTTAGTGSTSSSECYGSGPGGAY